jgi:ABC-type uncharacterized transport system involved in gliding motility auxiliary subunit
MLLSSLKTRQTKYGTYMVVYSAVVLAIVAAANYLGDRYNKTFDATENRIYSLSDQTTKILGNLDQDLKIYYFDQAERFDQPSPGGMAPRDQLVRYENASHRVSVDYIDPDSKPDLAQAMNVRTYGTVFVEMAGNREEADSTDEEDITNAVIRVIKGEEKTACFLTGHGEADGDDSEREGFSSAKEQIEDANYQTKTVSLLENPEVPDDCTLLLVAGPDKEYLEPEIDVLRSYIEGGGRTLFLVDHDKSPRLVEMLGSWGAKVNSDTVIDLSGVGQFFGMGPLSPLVGDYESHPISEAMGNVASFFPLVRSVEAGDTPEGWTAEKLFSTTAGSFASEDFSLEDGEVTRNPDKEREGPISLAVAATYDVPAAEENEEEGGGDEADPESSEDETDSEDEKKEGRIVVVGTSMFVRNNFIGRGGNADLFLNMLNWLSSDEDLISIRPRDPDNTPLSLTGADMSRLFFGTVVGIPLVIIIAGIRVWWKRR